MSTKIALEEENQKLVSLASANAKLEADAKGYGISVIINALAKTDPKTLQALASVGMNPGQLIAIAFKELAESADKIGQLNISPDLLSELLATGNTK